MICESPIQWDNGCWETVNPDSRMTIRQCIWRVADYCGYCVTERQADSHYRQHRSPAGAWRCRAGRARHKEDKKRHQSISLIAGK